MRIFRKDLIMSDERPAIVLAESVEQAHYIGNMAIYKACPPKGYDDRIFLVVCTVEPLNFS